MSKLTVRDKHQRQDAEPHGFKTAAVLLNASCALIAVLVLIGWSTDNVYLTRIVPAWPNMVPNTAFGFLLGSIAIGMRLSSRPGMRAWSKLFALLLFVWGALFSLEWVLDADWGLRYWVFSAALHESSIYRVAPGTACGFMLVAAVLLLDGLAKFRHLSEVLLHTIGALAILRFAAFPFGVTAFAALKGFRTMAVLTSICFILHWLALMALRGSNGVLGIILSRLAGGRLARRLLLVALLIPFINGWLRLRLQELGSVSAGEAAVLSALLNSFIFSGFVLWAAWQLNESDAQRKQHEAELVHSEARLRRLFDSPMLGVFYWNLDGRILEANAKFLEMLGYQRADLESGLLRWDQLTPAEFHSIDSAKASDLAEDGLMQPYEKEFICAGGSRLPVLIGAATLDREKREGVAFVTDISELRRQREMLAARSAELALANEQVSQVAGRLRNVLDAAQDAVISMNAQGEIVEWNRASEALLGWSAAEALGKPVTLVIPPQYHDDHIRGLKYYIESGEGPVIGRVIEIEALHRDGRILPVELSVGRPEGSGRDSIFTAFVADISEKRLAQETIAQRNVELELLNAELQRSESRMRAMFDSPMVGAYMWRIDGSIFAANAQMLKITGFSEEDLEQGRLSWQSLAGPLHADYPELAAQVLRLRGGFGPAETEVLRADGSPIQVMTGAYMADPQREEGIAFMLDISAQHQSRATIRERNAELEALTAELERSQAHLQRLFNSPMLGILHWSAEGKLLSANDRLLEMLGFTRQDFDEGKLGWEHVAPPEFAEIDSVKMGALTTGEDIEPYEKEFVRADGSRLPVLVGAATLDVERGEGVAYAADASELRRQRELVEARNQELLRINAELDSFSYSVSHDLRAPLRAIEGFSKALEEDYLDTLDDSAKRYLARIRAGTVRMAQLIDDLLQLSRIGRQELNPQLVDLSDLAQVVRRTLSESSPDRVVDWQIQPGMFVRGDPRLLRIALDNLLGNAFKFTSKCSEASISFGRQMTKDGMAYCVRDNGDGFDMAYASKLFTAFQRLHQQEQFPGTGIGLSIVRRIVGRHGGDIWAEAAPGKGAAFFFMLRLGEQSG